VWSAGLLAETKRIFVFATIHTAFNHPIVAAKQMATVDQIAHGRAGINVVAGWNQPEYETFGMDLPQSHDDRYALAQEWLDIVKKIWTTPGKFDWDGKFFQLQHVEGMPKPYDGMLPVLNAGSSTQGRAFAAKNANFVFTIVGGPDDGAEVVKTVTTQAKDEYHRNAGVLTLGHCVVRPTEKEAQELAQAQLKNFMKLAPRRGKETAFIREPTAAAWIVTLTADKDQLNQLTPSIKSVIAHYDYTKLYYSQFFWVEMAWERLRAEDL
jgi:alkanesulfonate monooxygenase SsuD/methylene tetrahydromethanopterin reductase-like flavin-dependent oxidoreductase (luciferase family)